MSYASLIEPFRAANRLSGHELYEWAHYSIDGQPVRPSTGVAMQVDGIIDGNLNVDMLFVCAGGNPALFEHRPTFAALRRLSARGIVIGGVSGGAFLLARAGILGGYRCTIHWEHEPAFVEEFPDLAFERGLYIIDRARITCAGGTAGLDLVTELIAAAHSPELAQLVSDWFIRTQKRPAEGAQRAAISQRYRVSHPGLVTALEAMEANTGTRCAGIGRRPFAASARAVVQDADAYLDPGALSADQARQGHAASARDGFVESDDQHRLWIHQHQPFLAQFPKALHRFSGQNSYPSLTRRVGPRRQIHDVAYGRASVACGHSGLPFGCIHDQPAIGNNRTRTRSSGKHKPGHPGSYWEAGK